MYCKWANPRSASPLSYSLLCICSHCYVSVLCDCIACIACIAVVVVAVADDLPHVPAGLQSGGWSRSGGRQEPHLGLALVLLQADLARGAALGQLQVLVHIIPGQ